MEDVKYPEVIVQLVGAEGNALSIVSRVYRALRRAGVSSEECVAFLSDALSGDYNCALITCMHWVTVI